MKEFGYFVTESSKHMSEYVPWYQHDREFMNKWEYHGDVVKPRRQAWFKDMGVKVSSAESIKLVRSHEYASEIMEAVTMNSVMKFNGNVMNTGRLIENLPPNCCVEVPILTDKQGLHPCHVGMLPAVCAALNRLNINVQELAVEACRYLDRTAAVQALLLDPSVNAVLSIAGTHKMFDEMWEAEGPLLEAYNNKVVSFAKAV
jgi:alpha-galactosidase